MHILLNNQTYAVAGSQLSCLQAAPKLDDFPALGGAPGGSRRPPPSPAAASSSSDGGAVNGGAAAPTGVSDALKAANKVMLAACSEACHRLCTWTD